MYEFLLTQIILIPKDGLSGSFLLGERTFYGDDEEVIRLTVKEEEQITKNMIKFISGGVDRVLTSLIVSEREDGKLFEDAEDNENDN